MSEESPNTSESGHTAWPQVVGRLAEKRAATEQALQGLLVRHGAQDSLMHPSDLPFFTKLHPGRVLQRQLLALHKPFSEVPKLPLPSHFFTALFKSCTAAPAFGL